MSDYNISANITANTKGYEAGINKVQKTTKSFSASLSKVIQGLGKNGLVGAMGSIGLASAGLSATLGAVVKIAKQVSQTIGECTEAYKQQLIAERQLETAINNNPLVTGSAKKRLTEFASEMQKVSNYGDEQLIPMMANLVSLGRTEEETMKIMAVAMDMSASGSMSLDTAITQLNATLNGNIGRLGQQNAELKGLTDEELKSGKAIDILGEKFKGLSQATLDTSKQLKNIKGDFKEAIGEFTLPSSDMWNNFWIGFYDKGISVIKQFDEYMDKTIIGKGIAEELIKGYKSISDERQKVLYLEDNIHALTESQIVALQKHLESTKNRNKEQEELLRKVKMEVEARTYLAKIYEDMDREEAQRQKTEEEQLAIENEIAILKGKYLEKMAEQERKWKNIKDVTGEEVKNEEKIKFYQDSLVDLMTQAGGQITTNNQLYKDQIAIIQKLQAELKPEEKETSNTWVEKIREQAIKRLEAERDSYKETVDLEKTTALERYLVVKDYNEKIYELQRERIIAEMETALKSVEGYANAEEEKVRITEYYNNELADLAKQNVTTMEAEGTEAGKAFGEGFAIAVSVTKEVAKKIISVIKSAISAIKGAIKSAINIFKNLFKFDPDEALNNLLAFEDSVLTFFVETLPQLPYFFESAMSSVATLIDTLLETVDWAGVEKIINDIVETFNKYVPRILNGIIGIFEKLVEPVSNAILNMMNTIVNSGVFETISNFLTETIFAGLPSFLKSLIIGVVKSLKSLINVVVDLLPSLINAVLEVLDTLIGEVLPDLLPTLLDAILEIIKALVRAVPKLSGQIIKLVSAIIKALPPILSRLIPEIVQVVIEVLPQIITEVVKAVADLIKNLTTQDLLSIIFAVGEMIIKIVEAVITFIPNTIAEIFKEIKTSIENMSWEGIKNAFKNGWKEITDNFKKTWNDAIDSISSSFENAFKAIKDAIQWIWDKIQSIIEGVGKVTGGIKDAVEKAGGGTVATFVETAVEKVTDTAKKTGSAIKSGAEWVGGKIKGLFGFANGTNNAPRGLAMVGEAGPELVRFRGGEQVLNNRNTQKLIAGSGKGASVFNVTFNNTQDTTAFAMMSQLKQYQRNLAFNGVL